MDGKALDKVGAGAPLEVEALGVVPITAAGREIWPQFAQQFTGQVFLLDQPGSVLAESIADVSRVGVLNEALRNAQSDRRALSSELKVRLGDVTRYEAQEASYAGLDGVEALALEAETLKAQADRLSLDRDEARGIHDALLAHQAVVSTLAPVRDVEVPDEAPAIRSELAELDELRDLALRLSGAEDLAEALAPVSKVGLPDPSRSAKLFEALSVVSDLRRQMAPLLQATGDAAEVRAASSVPLPDPAPLADEAKHLEGYRQLQGELASRTRALVSLREELRETETTYDEVLHEVKDILGDAGSCPICGHP